MMRWTGAGLLMLVVACSTVAEPDRVRVLGAIAGYNNDDPRIEVVPGADRSVTVRVTTYGDGCYTEGETEVLVQGASALVTPYDYTAPPGTACTRILRSFAHEAVVHFAAGTDTARVVVRGVDRRQASAANPNGDTIRVERVVPFR